jgi:pyruvyltransferase
MGVLSLGSVNVVHWNPSRSVVSGRLGKLIPIKKPINNFGDLLGPMIVDRIVELKGLRRADDERDEKRLLAVGSILRLARTGDVIWGIGANGKSLDGAFPFDSLDVRAVRGPMTADFLRRKGIAVPDIFGDPGLLVGRLWNIDHWQGSRNTRDVTVIPNLNDAKSKVCDSRFIDPRSEVSSVLKAISSSRFVTGSSLHAIVVAESFGIPARLVRSDKEPEFKYLDYYRGTGRSEYTPASSIEEAIDMGGEMPPEWDSEPLLNAFPDDLWESHSSASSV